MSKKTDELNDKQVLAIALLSTGQTQTDVAAQLDLSVSTVSRWNNQDNYKIALYQARKAQFDAIADKVRDARLKAINTLIGELDAPETKHRLQAAVALLRLDIPQPDSPTKFDLNFW
mgnify:CR=1 FL=1